MGAQGRRHEPAEFFPVPPRAIFHEIGLGQSLAIEATAGPGKRDRPGWECFTDQLLQPATQSKHQRRLSGESRRSSQAWGGRVVRTGPAEKRISSPAPAATVRCRMRTVWEHSTAPCGRRHAWSAGNEGVVQVASSVPGRGQSNDQASGKGVAGRWARREACFQQTGLIACADTRRLRQELPTRLTGRTISTWRATRLRA